MKREIVINVYHRRYRVAASDLFSSNAGQFLGSTVRRLATVVQCVRSRSTSNRTASDLNHFGSSFCPLIEKKIDDAFSDHSHNPTEIRKKQTCSTQIQKGTYIFVGQGEKFDNDII